MTDSAAPSTTTTTTAKLKLGALDISCHESTHTRMVMKSMSVRRLNPNSSRHDDLLRSGSTHQLLNRPFSSSQTGAAPPPMASLLGTIPQEGGEAPSAGAGAASLAGTAETAEDTLSDAGSEFSGGSFCDAEGDSPPNQDYLDKDLGASLHDDDNLAYKPDDNEKEDAAAADKS